MKTVAILLGTYNGEKFLGQQLRSFEQQLGCEWMLFVSDDGSTDSTLNLLHEFQQKYPARVSIYKGPSQGFVANFISLVQREEIDADFFAYADQDDAWQSDKLKRSINALSSCPEHIPSLYCARTIITHEDGSPAGYSPRFKRPPSFKNALVQNIAGGNTMLFNRSARSILASGTFVNGLGGHDWWSYLLITAAGGKVIYDPYPTVLYRQHDANLIGRNSGLLAKLLRIRMMFAGRYQSWNNANLTALAAISDKISPENLNTLSRFHNVRSGNIVQRFRALRASGVYRQTLLGNLGLYLACMFNRI